MTHAENVASNLTPDVGFNGEGIVGKALWRGPFNRKLGSGMSSIGVSSHQSA